MKNAQDLLQFVTFELVKVGEKNLKMALNVQKVKEVVELTTLSPLPSGMDHILGIYDLRGCPIPVLDVLGLISKGRKAPQLNEGSRLLICELQNIWVAIPVLTTGRILTCPSSHFLPPPAGSNVKTNNVITGLVRKEKTYIPVLDLDSLLNSIGIFENKEVIRHEKISKYTGKKVLIVDDSKLILKKLHQIFSQTECIVDQAENGAEALRKIKSQGPQYYDLIFTDIEMPLLDGISLAREIKAIPEYSKIPVLFNTALSNPALVSDIEKEGLGRYLVKFDSDLILKELKSLFGEQKAAA